MTQRRSNSRVVFLSHAAFDKDIALLLKKEIERRLPGTSVFCSSDPDSLPPGSKWSPTIQQALQDASMLIFIATEHSVQRPWVWFECGTFWFTNKAIMPLCLGPVRKNELRSPLSELQAVNGDEPNDLKTVFEVIAKSSGLRLSDTSSLDDPRQRYKDWRAKPRRPRSIGAGWHGVQWKGNFLSSTTDHTTDSIPK